MTREVPITAAEQQRREQLLQQYITDNKESLQAELEYIRGQGVTLKQKRVRGIGYNLPCSVRDWIEWLDDDEHFACFQKMQEGVRDKS